MKPCSLKSYNHVQAKILFFCFLVCNSLLFARQICTICNELSENFMQNEDSSFKVYTLYCTPLVNQPHTALTYIFYACISVAFVLERHPVYYFFFIFLGQTTLSSAKIVLQMLYFVCNLKAKLYCKMKKKKKDCFLV